MNFDLGNNNMNKLILLVVAGIALLLALNMYQKQIGKQVALLLAVVTIVVVGYFSYNLLNVTEQALQVEENFYNYTNPPTVEHFQAEADPVSNEVDENSNAAANNNAALLNAAQQEEAQVNEPAANSNNNAPVNASANNNNNNNLNCKDLLPSDSNSTWAQVNPSGVGDLCGRNLLNAGHHVGVNTQGCSMRNANRGLRSEPPNPQTQVSPWMQTTICPDLHRKPLE